MLGKDLKNIKEVYFLMSRFFSCFFRLRLMVGLEGIIVCGSNYKD